jgi:hypothetical protein
MNWDAIKPFVTLMFTSVLKVAGGALVTHGLISAGPGLEAFSGAAVAAGGAFWSWWVQDGHVQAEAYLKKLTDTATQAAAIEIAKKMQPASVTGAADTAKAVVTITHPDVMAADATKAISLMAADATKAA